MAARSERFCVVLSSLAPHEVVRLVVDEETGDIVQGGWDRRGGQFRPGVQEQGVETQLFVQPVIPIDHCL
jgi:hypothetical protein